MITLYDKMPFEIIDSNNLTKTRRRNWGKMKQQGTFFKKIVNTLRNKYL